MQQQDEQLDQVLHTVVNMKSIAQTINTELEDQQQLLGRMEEKVDTSDNRLKLAQKRLEKIMKDNNSGFCVLYIFLHKLIIVVDKRSMWCIVILSVIVVLLLVFVVV